MAVGRGPIGSEKAAEKLQALETKLEQCRRKFSMYFNGFEKQPPTVEFEHLKREFRELQQSSFSSAAFRFKAQNLQAKWLLHRHTWERDLQRMEDGTFKPGAQAAAMRGHKGLDKVDDME